MRVLIIDDEEDTRSIFSMSLGLLGGAEVIEAASGPAGIAKAAEEKPDVIILDLLMPDMDGTATFLNLKQCPDTENIPVIFMTVKGMFSEFDALKNLGALAVIAKPFDPTTLTNQIRSILNANGYGHVTGTGAPLAVSEPECAQVAELGNAPDEVGGVDESVETVEESSEFSESSESSVPAPPAPPAPVPAATANDKSSNNGHHGNNNGRLPEARPAGKRVPDRNPERKSVKPITVVQRILAKKRGGKSKKTKRPGL